MALKVSSEVSGILTTSKSFITGTGLKKWSPPNLKKNRWMGFHKDHFQELMVRTRRKMMTCPSEGWRRRFPKLEEKKCLRQGWSLQGPV